MNYFPAELHCHTLHSDGTFTLEELCRSAKNEGLAVIASTDHNTQSAQFELSDKLEKETLPVIRGIEWTTYFGHMLVLGASSFVDWRFAEPDTIDVYVSEVKRAGGIVGIAHPFDLGSPMCTGGHWDFNVQDWSRIDYIEIWHEDFPSVKTPNLRALDFWTKLLDCGFRIAPVYGRDWHGRWSEDVLPACTYLGTNEASITAGGAVEAISKGRTAMTLGPLFLMRLSDGNDIYHPGDSVSPGSYTVLFTTDESVRAEHWRRFNIKAERIRLVGMGGGVIREIPYAPGAVQLNVDLFSGWVRGELWGTVNGAQCALAITGAVYVR